MATFTELQAEVAAITTVRASVEALITKLVELLKVSQSTPDAQALAALMNELAANRTALAAAVVAGTPASTEPTARR